MSVTFILDFKRSSFFQQYAQSYIVCDTKSIISAVGSNVASLATKRERNIFWL